MTSTLRQRRSISRTACAIGRWRRRVVSLLGLFILAFNVVSAAAMPAPDGTSLPPFAQALADNHIVVCTALGMVVIDQNGNVVDGDGDGGSALCVFCLPLMHAGAKLPSAQPEAIRQSPVGVAKSQLATTPPAQPCRLAGEASPRAPPLG